jgi:hypothetical protein
MSKDLLNETFNKHRFLLKKKLHEQGIIQQQPIQEVELEEGLKDIALAGLLGLSTLFSTAATSSGEETAIKTAKLGDASASDLKARLAHLFPKDTPTAASSGEEVKQKNTSAAAEVSNVKNVAKNAEKVATEIATQINGGDDYSKSSAKKILDDVIKFNKDHKFGSAAQMKIAIEHAESNSRNTNKEKPNNESSLFGSMPDGIGNVLGTDVLNKIKSQADEISKSQAELLVKKYNVTDGYAEQRIYTTCYYSAIGDFIQMVAEKLVQVATRP